MPSYVTVNNGAEIKSLTIKNECLKCIKNNSLCGQVGKIKYKYNFRIPTSPLAKKL